MPAACPMPPCPPSPLLVFSTCCKTPFLPHCLSLLLFNCALYLLIVVSFSSLFPLLFLLLCPLLLLLLCLDLSTISVKLDARLSSLMSYTARLALPCPALARLRLQLRFQFGNVAFLIHFELMWNLFGVVRGAGGWEG